MAVDLLLAPASVIEKLRERGQILLGERLAVRIQIFGQDIELPHQIIAVFQKQLRPHLRVQPRHTRHVLVESAAVRVEYRGNGIQNQLIEYACDYLSKNCGNIRYVMATVSPDNIPSLKSFEKAGFKIILTK